MGVLIHYDKSKRISKTFKNFAMDHTTSKSTYITSTTSPRGQNKVYKAWSERFFKTEGAPSNTNIAVKKPPASRSQDIADKVKKNQR
jgi:hypothetical protein